MRLLHALGRKFDVANLPPLSFFLSLPLLLGSPRLSRASETNLEALSRESAPQRTLDPRAWTKFSPKKMEPLSSQKSTRSSAMSLLVPFLFNCVLHSQTNLPPRRTALFHSGSKRSLLQFSSPSRVVRTPAFSYYYFISYFVPNTPTPQYFLHKLPIFSHLVFGQFYENERYYRRKGNSR